MTIARRRYDIDWLRVIAIGLLLIYHAAIGFQPWGIMIGFIGNDKTWDALWIPMSMLNVWRIPLLFFVSGMGIYFAMQNRNWKQLLKERSFRILLPFLFGILFIFPISVYIWQHYYQFEKTYNPHPGHLWFLGNIFAYVLMLVPVLFYLKKDENGKVAGWIKKIFSNPLGLLIVLAVFVAEAVVIDPNPYTLYVLNWHGFTLGLLAFFFGFCFVLSGAGFWNMLLKWKWFFLLVAVLLFVYRLNQFQMRVPSYQLAVESNFWIFSVFAFGHRYLNRPGKVLRYLSEAAYPVYILHMVFLYLASWLIFKIDMNVYHQFISVLVLTFAGCFIAYEFVVRRINVVRPFFGLKMRKRVSALSDDHYGLPIQKVVQ